MFTYLTKEYDNNGNLITELKGEKQSAAEMQPIVEIGVVGETASGVNIYEYDNRNRLKQVICTIQYTMLRYMLKVTCKVMDNGSYILKYQIPMISHKYKHL